MTKGAEEAELQHDGPNRSEIDTPFNRNAANIDLMHQQSLVRLYQDYAPTLAASIRKIYGNGPPDPEDIAQAAFEKVLARGSLSTIDNLKAFLWSTARNLVRREIRSKDVRERYAADVEEIFFAQKGDDLSPERIISARDQLKQVNEVLRAMPDKRRQAVYLHRIEGLPVAEVARRLGISRSAAVKHVARGLEDIDLHLASSPGG